MKHLLLSSAAALALMASVADADPISYTETVTGSGSLDGVPFDNALVTLNMITDTSGIVEVSSYYSYYYYYYDVLGLFEVQGTATVSVSGAATDTFSDQIEVFDDQGFGNGPGWAGFLDDSTGILFQYDPSFVSYNLETFIGPLGDEPQIYGYTFPTAGGDFYIDSTTGNATFTAAAPPDAPVVPEPGTMSLLGTFLGGLGWVSMRRRGHRGMKHEMDFVTA